MNFGSLGGMGGAVAGYLATPEGQEAAKQFLASPDGINLLKSFAASPAGQKALFAVVPTLLEGVNLPPGAKEMILAALPK
ncbi:MAG: hypothetical protein WC586_04115 [Methanoregula sp.]